MDELSLLRHWAEIAGLPSDSVHSKDDLVGFFQRFRPDGEGVELLLSEATYGMANDQFLERYLLWPLLEDGAQQDAPFDPYFEMWARGIACTLPEEGVCELYVPGTGRAS